MHRLDRVLPIEAKPGYYSEHVSGQLASSQNPGCFQVSGNDAVAAAMIKYTPVSGDSPSSRRQPREGSPKCYGKMAVRLTGSGAACRL